jgi:hypothetical protein
MLQCCWGSDPHALAPDACGPCSIPYREMIGCKRGWTRREFLVERAAATAQITSLCRSPFCGRYAASNCCPHLIASTNLLRFPCSGVSRTHPQQTLLQSLLIQQFICSSCLLKANVFLRDTRMNGTGTAKEFVPHHSHGVYDRFHGKCPTLQKS